jgi:hypothetical protein
VTEKVADVGHRDAAGKAADGEQMPERMERDLALEPSGFNGRRVVARAFHVLGVFDPDVGAAASVRENLVFR